jgi:L-seryl-tRNA(Ser) seleniumtransferase
VSPDDPRRRVPRTDVALADPRLVEAAGRLGGGLVKAAVAQAQALARTGTLAPEQVVDAAVAALPQRRTTLRPVLNATGVVLHTNLGRAPLSPAAVDAVRTAAGYVDVEYDVGDGSRARRGRGALAALREAVPAAEDALVVNNGAAALVLATTALAAGREVVVSRGEMVEIGDGFRLPDLIASTGARLREVGHHQPDAPARLRRGRGADTGCVLKVHPEQLPRRGLHQLRSRWPSWPASGCRSWPTSAAGCSRRTRCCRTSRTRRPRSGRGGGRHRQRGQAPGRARRPACCSAAPTWSSGCAGTRWRVRCGSTS